MEPSRLERGRKEPAGSRRGWEKQDCWPSPQGHLQPQATGQGSCPQRLQVSKAGKLSGWGEGAVGGVGGSFLASQRHRDPPTTKATQTQTIDRHTPKHSYSAVTAVNVHTPSHASRRTCKSHENTVTLRHTIDTQTYSRHTHTHTHADTPQVIHTQQPKLYTCVQSYTHTHTHRQSFHFYNASIFPLYLRCLNI